MQNRFGNLLRELRNRSVFRALVAILRQRDCLFRPLAVSRSPFVKIEGSWEDYIRGRSRNTYRDLKKKINRLAAVPGLKVELVTGRAEYLEHVQRMLNMHLKLWFSRGQTTPYMFPERRIFLKENLYWRFPLRYLNQAPELVNCRGN